MIEKATERWEPAITDMQEVTVHYTIINTAMKLFALCVVMVVFIVAVVWYFMTTGAQS